MFKDLNIYITRPEFREGFYNSYKKHRGHCEFESSKSVLNQVRESLLLQYTELLETKSNYVKMLEFNLDPNTFFNHSFDLNSCSNFESQRISFIDSIVELMFVTRSNFGAVELQRLYGNVVSSHQVYDVIYSLKILDHISDLYLLETGSPFVDKLENSSTIEVFGTSLNKLVFDYVGDRLLNFSPAREMASVSGFLKFVNSF